ncbi:MAG: hypothetical protein P4L99_06890 [Chthoniobacter sp.]|nr:hypothetical protein [Chthoniobacter sp.]
MKRLSLILTILGAILFTPAGAFASDKDKHYHKHKHHDNNGNNGNNRDYQDQQAQIEADRRANGYYDAPRYTPSYHRNYAH